MSTDFTRRNFMKGAALTPVAAMPQSSAALPALHTTWQTVEVRTQGDRLIVSTGLVERTWRWTGKGFVTTSLRDLRTKRDWASREPAVEADWDHPDSAAKLVRLTATPVRFDPFTSDRVEIAADIEYPTLAVRFVIWAYADSPGLRTQLFVKARTPAGGASRRADYLPIDPADLTRRAVGYFNHTQGRNKRETPILREEAHTSGEVYDWASLLCLEDGSEGVCLVKESHKCVNQPGVDTGDFRVSASGVSSTGWGPPQSGTCWANWTIVYGGSADGRELAIKTFDRQRFPVDPARDIYIMANTWGSGAAKQESLDASQEENILRQIDSCADLGIDVQQIDDGWQGDNQYKTWSPVKKRYPEGWKNVRRHAREAGIRLGLWGAWVIDDPALRKTHDEGGFNYYKIDFARLDTYDKLETLMDKMRRLIAHSGHTVRVNWDVTENPARVGYYYARDLGNIYLENRKPFEPAHVVYVPYLVLRDAWHVAHYTNLNRFQISVQNIERVNREISNAHLHTHPYSVAITLMGSPIFFQETTYYTREARDQIRPLLALYKQHRHRMYRGYVFAIGDEPNDAAWSGFQNHEAKTASGYLTIFRELHAANYKRAIALRFLAGKRIRLIDLEHNVAKIIELPADGKVWFEIDTAPGYGFYRYEVL
ncbi:MAG: hypothetical protein GY953_48330 [bacterium]|nr:hypothetical protein [bacterium]